MIGHKHKSMESKSSLPAISIQRLQEKPCVRFHDKQSSALECRERYEICSRRRHQSRRFHDAGPQRLKPNLQTSLIWCDCKSHPSRLIILLVVPFRENVAALGND
jgi:hypothetical protein